MHLSRETYVSAYVLDINRRKTPLKGLLDTGAVWIMKPIKTRTVMGFDEDGLIVSRIRLSAANKGALRVLDRTPIKALILRETLL